MGIEKKLKSRRAQTAVELAIFSTLLLVAFSSVLMYGQQLSGQQRVKQETFRKALRLAFNKNSSVTFNLKRNERFANLFGGYFQGQGNTLSGHASVMWQKGLSGSSDTDDEQGFSYYQIDDGSPFELDRRKKKVYNYDGSEKEVMVPVEVWKEETARTEDYHGEKTRSENAGGIAFNNNATLAETVSINMHTRHNSEGDPDPSDDEPGPKVYVDTGTKGVSSGKGYSYSSSWTVGH